MEDGKAIDVPTFFKRQNHVEFTRFWRGASNGARRKKFHEATKRFANALDDYEVE